MENYKAIAHLIIKYRKATLNEQEQSQLNEWLEQSVENRNLFKRLTDESYLATVSSIDLDAERKEVIRLSRNMNKQGTSVIWLNRYSVAATLIVIVLSFFVWAVFIKKPKATTVAHVSAPEKSIAQSKDPPPLYAYTPGKSKAVLILENGSKIFLDTVPDGLIASIGNIDVVKLKNGEIKVNPSSGKANEITAHSSHLTLYTPRGGQYQLTLIDGSRVKLNASSVFRFPASFNEQERNVSLSGEAYFEVSNQKALASNANERFIVNVNAVKVYVVGTRFNIMSYEDEDVMKTTLEKGSVEITKGAVKKIITSGQQAQVNKKSDIFILKKVNVPQETAWMNKEIKLSNATLEQVIRQISRLYDIDITIDEKTNSVNHFNVDIPGNTPLPEALGAVQELSKVSYKYEEGRVLFSK